MGQKLWEIYLMGTHTQTKSLLSEEEGAAPQNA